jgi:hypothetical protein
MDREKRELNERMRIVAKRLDHIERAFRKAELPLLADDYARQQADDKAPLKRPVSKPSRPLGRPIKIALLRSSGLLV